MVAQLKQPMTTAVFDDWVHQQSEDYEYVAGEAVPVVSNNYCSMIAAKILTFIGMYLLESEIGYVTGSDGGYVVQGERYIPDVGFIGKDKQPEPCHEAYNPQPPDLAVEVVSPTDAEKRLLVKTSNYLASGTTVWIVYPDEKVVHVHRPGRAVQAVKQENTLTGDEVLPGFSLTVAKIFPAEGE